MRTSRGLWARLATSQLQLLRDHSDSHTLHISSSYCLAVHAHVHGRLDLSHPNRTPRPKPRHAAASEFRASPPVPARPCASWRGGLAELAAVRHTCFPGAGSAGKAGRDRRALVTCGNLRERGEREADSQLGCRAARALPYQRRGRGGQRASILAHGRDILPSAVVTAGESFAVNIGGTVGGMRRADVTLSRAHSMVVKTASLSAAICSGINCAACRGGIVDHAGSATVSRSGSGAKPTQSRRGARGLLVPLDGKLCSLPMTSSSHSPLPLELLDAQLRSTKLGKSAQMLESSRPIVAFSNMLISSSPKIEASGAHCSEKRLMMHANWARYWACVNGRASSARGAVLKKQMINGRPLCRERKSRSYCSVKVCELRPSTLHRRLSAEIKSSEDSQCFDFTHQQHIDGYGYGYILGPLRPRASWIELMS